MRIPTRHLTLPMLEVTGSKLLESVVTAHIPFISEMVLRGGVGSLGLAEMRSLATISQRSDICTATAIQVTGAR